MLFLQARQFRKIMRKDKIEFINSKWSIERYASLDLIIPRPTSIRLY